MPDLVKPMDIDETQISGEKPLVYVKRLALEKAKISNNFFKKGLPLFTF